MPNILALLDATIDDLARQRTSRTSRQAEGAPPVVRCEKSLFCAKNPEVPVVPVEHGRTASGLAICVSDCGTTPNTPSDFLQSIYLETGSTGSTGSTRTIKSFCGFRTSRPTSTRNGITGSTGTDSHFSHFLDHLDPEEPPGDVPMRRWQQFITDATVFVESGFAEQAEALGWSDADLFGCDDARPFARIDQMGLVWLLNGDSVIAITADTAVIESQSGARMVFRRKSPPEPRLTAKQYPVSTNL